MAMKIHEHKNFLTATECQAVIDQASLSFSRATVVGPESAAYHAGRVAESAWLPQDSQLSIDIRSRLSDMIGIPVCNMEAISVVRYYEGGEYQPHVDWFDPDDVASFMAMTLFGGQRVCSALMYLNEDFMGGETVFPNVDVTVKPELGKLLLWYNHDEHGALSRDNLHAGLPVTSGVKYIAIVWVRELRYWGDEACS